MGEVSEPADAEPVSAAADPDAEHEALPRRASDRKNALGFDQAIDPWLFFAAIALSCVGLVMIFSSSAWLAHEAGARWTHYLERQSVFLVVGIAVMLGLSRLDYRVLRRFAPQLMLAGLAALVLVLFVGREVNGARRWISLGPVNLQSSEIAKLALVVFLSATLARQGERIRNFKTGFMPPMIAASLAMILVLLENDLGTTLLLGALTLTLLYVAGTRASYVVAAVMVALPVAWQFVVGVEFRRGRIESFLSGSDYQVQQGLISIGSGGPYGLGLGAGKQKLGFLPENHTDFILATIGEEIGLLGIVLVIALFTLLVWRGLAAARQAPDRFGTYLGVGLAALFGLQALINMAVVLRVIPAKGITLPFVSYGGSSLLASMAGVGLLLSISRRPRPWKLSDQRGRRDNAKDPGKEARRADGNRKNVRMRPSAV
jgi:cell division protein FtsW